MRWGIGRIVNGGATQRMVVPSRFRVPGGRLGMKQATGGKGSRPGSIRPNPELLRRRAMARCSIVTPEGKYPFLGDAEDDLRLILAVDPYNLSAGAELLDAMFRFSGMEDSDVARVAGQFAEKAQQLLLQLIALQIKALGYAGRHIQSDRVYEKWAKVFPKSKCLRMAKKDADEIRPAVKSAARVQKSQLR